MSLVFGGGQVDTLNFNNRMHGIGVVWFSGTFFRIDLSRNPHPLDLEKHAL